MALLGQIIAGLEIGNGITDVVVKYSKEQYLAKIEKLQACLGKLETHNSNLEGLKERLKNIWADDQAKEYLKDIEEQLKSVKNAHDNTTRQVNMWESAIKEMEDTVGAQQDKISAITGAVKALNIAD